MKVFFTSPLFLQLFKTDEIKKIVNSTRIFPMNHLFLKMGHSRPLFLYFCLFYKQLTVNKCSIKVADDWIRTWVLWYRKRPLCQLRHNHCPNESFVCKKILMRQMAESAGRDLNIFFKWVNFVYFRLLHRTQFKCKLMKE